MYLLSSSPISVHIIKFLRHVHNIPFVLTQKFKGSQLRLAAARNIEHKSLMFVSSINPDIDEHSFNRHQSSSLANIRRWLEAYYMLTLFVVAATCKAMKLCSERVGNRTILSFTFPFTYILSPLMISYVWMAHDPFLINKLFDFSCKPY